jgi:hypothetical protein
VAPQGSSEAGHCFRACASDDDCPRAGYRCTPFGDGERVIHACHPRADTLPDGVVGTPCGTDAQCEGGAAVCFDGLPRSVLAEGPVPAEGGYCSAACLFDEDCGAGAQCISGGTAGGQCMANCDDASPCREGYRCLAHMRDLGDARQVCTPIWDAPAADAGL